MEKRLFCFIGLALLATACFNQSKAQQKQEMIAVFDLSDLDESEIKQFETAWNEESKITEQELASGGLNRPP